MNKLLVICGPTATGKTSLALHLAKALEGELVSADSRQVYVGMNIGTGKEIPKGFGFRNSDLEIKGSEVGYYSDGDTRIWGYDLVEPSKNFSVGKYLKYTDAIIGDIRKRGKLPILVGGTGLYIKAVVDRIPTAEIPKNKNLRKSLEGKLANELFEILAALDPIRVASMNTSDKKNPRRLIRAIEVAEYNIHLPKRRNHPKKHLAVLFVGLTAPKKYLFDLVDKRVDARVKFGQEKEVKSLLLSGVSWDSQAVSALGYGQWRKFFEKKAPKRQIIDLWRKDERNYVKRQITWFKRDKRVAWFDISNQGWHKSVEKLVKKWYSSKHNGFA